MTKPLISLAQIKLKAQKIWESHLLQRNYVEKEDCFPIIIPLPAFSAKQLQHDFPHVRNMVKELTSHSKEIINHGYQLIFKEINHRQLGTQSLPVKALFSSEEDFLCFINKKSDYRRFRQSVDSILFQYPTLKNWIYHHTAQISSFEEKWDLLLTVCHFMQKNPKPMRYIRELDIPGIDTKFIENHKKILSELFDELLPSHAINHEIVSRHAHYFEQRYYFKHDEQLIRFRLLDKSSFHDISVPLGEFRHLALPHHQIYITENKINGLSFPAMENAIVIFGLGYGIQSLRDIHWLREKQIIYWGDIDTHGFAILSQLRSYYPQTENILMDDTTIKTFQHLWTDEPEDKRCVAKLQHLTHDEQILYQNLINNIWGKNIRLEQERISFKYLISKLAFKKTF